MVAITAVRIQKVAALAERLAREEKFADKPLMYRVVVAIGVYFGVGPWNRSTEKKKFLAKTKAAVWAYITDGTLPQRKSRTRKTAALDPYKKDLNDWLQEMSGTLSQVNHDICPIDGYPTFENAEPD
ncbi:MAG: hypothetical protein RI996_506 [Candidatus Parcubacteria bacterium]|jgi:hypothetical protein